MKCLSCNAFHFSPSCLSTTASFSLIMRLRKCSLRIWHWQMSNYSSYIHVSRLWPARPAISPIDAECEHRACQRRRLGRWRAPFWHVIHHRFHLTAAAVSPSLSQTTDLAEDTWEDGQNVSLWDQWPADESTEKPSVILTAVTSLSIQNVSGRAAAAAAWRIECWGHCLEEAGTDGG